MKKTDLIARHGGLSLALGMRPRSCGAARIHPIPMHLLAQNDDTAFFTTVPEVYTATQARTRATVGVSTELTLRWRTS